MDKKDYNFLAKNGKNVEFSEFRPDNLKRRIVARNQLVCGCNKKGSQHMFAMGPFKEAKIKTLRSTPQTTSISFTIPFFLPLT